MTDDKTIEFGPEDITESPEILAGWGNLATETIDLESLSLNRLSETGSFLLSGIEKTALGKLLQSIPIPVLLLDLPRAGIRFVNPVAEEFLSHLLEQSDFSFFNLFSEGVRPVQGALNKLLITRKHQKLETWISLREKRNWVRMHFRSLRHAGERFGLVLMEDLTHEKAQLSQKAAELQRQNEILTSEITQRRQIERNLRREVVNREQVEAKLRQALGSTIRALSKVSEMKDPYTAGHQRRVTQLARAIALEMGLEETRINTVAIAATVHDIGKINVPAELLSKPGTLTEDEFGIIKEHPSVGYEILKETGLAKDVAQTVLQHHERINGKGYPQSLKGNNILLEARIVSVADVLEAMSSHRPYRPARRKSDAITEISQNKGILYDPYVVDACLTVLRNGFVFT